MVLSAGKSAVTPFDKPPDHPCEYMKSMPRKLDIDRLVSMRLDATPNDILSEAEVNKIANDSFQAVKAFDEAHRKLHPLDAYIGVGFQVDIVSYDEKHKTVLLGGFAVHVDSNGTPALWRNTPFQRLSEADRLGIMVVGDRDFAAKYIHTAQMQAILGKSIGQVSLADATSAALNYVVDGEKSSEIVKDDPHSPIGGPIDVATITRAGIHIKRH